MSQLQTIRAHLAAGQSITQQQSGRDYRVWRLAARIEELRRIGMAIKTDMIMDRGKRFARYSLDVKQ